MRKRISWNTIIIKLLFIINLISIIFFIVMSTKKTLNTDNTDNTNNTENAAIETYTEEDQVAKTTVVKASFMDVFMKVIISDLIVFIIILIFTSIRINSISKKLASSIDPEEIKERFSMDMGAKEMLIPVNKKVPNITFNDVEGIPEVKREAKYLVEYLKNPYKYKNMGARMPKGVILYGPPGTGKTLIAKAIAGTAGVPFLSVTGSDFMELYVGVGARRVRQLFAEASKLAPCIVFIDEIDAIGAKRGENKSGERDQTINALLAEMDGFKGNSGIMVIAATNRLDILDPALTRSGRFDKHIAVGLPNKQERLSILKLYAKNKRFDETVNLDVIAAQTTGFSGADLESLLNESAIIAVNNGKKAISKDEIDRAFFKIVMKGDIKEDKKRSRKELETVAWHEAGHALITKLLTKDEITKVTILASTSGAGGVTFHNPSEEEGNLYSKTDLKNRIAIYYGGRAAEEILYNDKSKITIGASEDIKQASSLIKQYITKYGMSEEFGLIDFDVFEREAISYEKMISEATSLSKEIYEYTLNMLKENKEYLQRIADELLEKETLLNEDIDRILGRVSNSLVIEEDINGQLELTF